MSSQNSTRRRSLVKKCRNCDGKGFVFKEVHGIPGKANCPKCHGRGAK